MVAKIEVIRKNPTQRRMSSDRISNDERQLPPERDTEKNAAQAKLDKGISQPQPSSYIPDDDPPKTLSNSDKLADEQKLLTNQKMMVLLENLSDEQFCRYEMYRRSKFSKPTIKKLVKQITGGQNINEKTAIALAGVAKVFVGQLIENALDYKETLNESGPLKPKHIREANRQLQNKSTKLY